MDLSEFERDNRIDPEQLDVECVRQPELFWKWSTRAIEARGEVDRLKLKAEVVEAQLQLEVRKLPGAFGLEKPTEAAVTAVVKGHKRYLAAMENYHQARDDSSMLDKAVVAMEIKKRMLETLVTLHGQQYFAGPSVPRNLGEAYLAQHAALDKRVAERQRFTVRKRKSKKED